MGKKKPIIDEWLHAEIDRHRHQEAMLLTGLMLMKDKNGEYAAAHRIMVQAHRKAVKAFGDVLMNPKLYELGGPDWDGKL